LPIFGCLLKPFRGLEFSFFAIFTIKIRNFHQGLRWRVLFFLRNFALTHGISPFAGFKPVVGCCGKAIWRSRFSGRFARLWVPPFREFLPVYGFSVGPFFRIFTIKNRNFPYRVTHLRPNFVSILHFSHTFLIIRMSDALFFLSIGKIAIWRFFDEKPQIS